MQAFIKKYGVALLVLFLAWQVFNQYKQIGPHNQVLRADGKGYYAYLPALFIYHDHQMNFIGYYEHKYNGPEDYCEFRQKLNGTFVDKYYAGVAILQLPFFLLSHVVSYLLRLPTDGYAPLYQQFFALGALFYLFIGLQAFLLYLMAWKIPAWQGLLAICFIVLGTNCYHYAVYEQCMSHVFSLSMFFIFIYGIYNVVHLQSRKWIINTLFVLGMIVILRPVNVIIIGFIPFIAGNGKNLKSAFGFLFKNYGYLVVGIFAMLLPFMIQSLLWHWQTGIYIVYSYGKEAMEWGNPKIWYVLFSYGKGWFIWSPIAFIGICGLFLFIKNIYRFLSIALFMCQVVYILSCWWDPAYGMGFGAREFIEYLFVPGIALAALLQKTRIIWLRLSIIGVCSLLVYVNLVQEAQYRHHIILWCDMDKQTYWRVFMQTNAGYFYWLEERQGFKRPELITKGINASYANDFENNPGWDNENRFSEKEAHSGIKSNYIDAHYHVSAVFNHELTADELKRDSIIQASVWFYGPQPDVTALVISFENNNVTVSKDEARIRKFADHNYQWNKAILQMPIPARLPVGTVLKVYIDNKFNTELFYLDDFRVDFIGK